MKEDNKAIIKDELTVQVNQKLVGGGCGCSSISESEIMIDNDVPKKYLIQAGENNQPIFPAELVKMLGMENGSSIQVVLYENKVEIYPNIHSLSKLYIEPTSRCNLDCRTCIRETWNEPLGSMDINVFDSLVEQIKEFKTLRTVMFGGFGEPTFHPDILYMIARIKSLGLTVEMVTNGTLLNEEMTEGLIRSGLDTLWVSFDGSSAENFEDIRAGANFDAVVQNLVHLKKINRNSCRKVKVGIAFVVMKKNINELKNLGVLARKVGAKMVSVSNVIPYSEDMVEEMVCDLGVESNRKHYVGSIPINIPNIDMTEITKQPLYELFRDCDNISIMKNKVGAETESCRFIKERCTFVRWDGKVSPCMGLLHSYKTYFSMGKIQREVSNYSLGDIEEKKLKDIWNSKEYYDFREKVNTFDFSPCLQCGPCNLAENNEEDCFGNTFPTCGGCLWGQGVIQCP
ncbi:MULTISPECIES: radical SAM protein [unclassified Dehalobacter]|uniref:radical SAM protein n=1 Tax=unclassified Dehalobacter TaxID=2635733 RepID=UPI00028A4775|nr:MULTISPECIES: radical SAM protein [unclassified Dehalobacter]AFV01199.1 Radical SAM domain protein [Dehalobacter sp. DCA]AFV04240.1 Tungsten-containing aldehyde ferredoxin oxidoreductase cofactor-modifying protein [Dehalobacter sp. CF]